MPEPRRPPPPPVTRPAPSEIPPRDVSRRQRPAQFSMRALLIGVTLVAVALALLQLLGPAAPIVAALLGGALISAMPICFGTLALYTRGNRQTFFLGAFVGSLGPMLHGVAGALPGELFIFLAMNFATALGCGYLALVTRRFAERRGWHLPARGNDSDSRD